MHETLKYWLESCWLIFLFLPLLVAITITVFIGIAGIWGIICHWLVPATIYAKDAIYGLNRKRDDVRKSTLRLYNFCIAMEKTVNVLRNSNDNECKELVKQYDEEFQPIKKFYL